METPKHLQFIVSTIPVTNVDRANVMHDLHTLKGIGRHSHGLHFSHVQLSKQTAEAICATRSFKIYCAMYGMEPESTLLVFSRAFDAEVSFTSEKFGVIRLSGSDGLESELRVA